MNMLMRRVLAVVTLLVSLPAATVSAQTFGYGGKAGVNFASVRYDGDEDLNPTAQAGLVAGGFVTFGLFWKLGVEADVFYSVRSAEYDGGIVDTLTYVDVPILARVAVVTKPSWRVHALAGGVIGSLQKAEETHGGTADDIAFAIESLETAVAVGAELELRGRWLIDFRYLYGLSDVTTSPNFKATSRTFQIMGGYRFR